MIGISLIFILLFGYSGYLWWLGGVAREISKYTVIALLALIMTNWLAVWIYTLWEGLTITPTPWLSYTLLTQLPPTSLAFKHFILCLLVSSLGGALLLSAKWFSGDRDKSVFGRAHFANVFEINRAGLFSEEGIILGKAFGKLLRLPGFESVLVTAPTGGGKTTSIAIPNLLEWRGSGIFNDLKGELFQKTAVFREKALGNTCFCWNPADERMQGHRYNPFYYVSQNPKLRIRDLQLIAETLIPAERVDGGFWYTSARDIFLMLALYLLETEGAATLSEIHDLSKQERFIDWLKCVVERQQVKDPVFYQNAYSLLNSDQEKTQKNILKDFHSRMALYSDPLTRYATDGNDFDLRNLRRERMSIYIQIPDADKYRLKPILTLFWAQSINLMTREEPNFKQEPYPVLALLDEFGNMARIEKLKDGMSFFRSYRMRAIVLVQYLSQITSIYGQHDAKAFLNSKVKIAFALNDIDDAKFFSESLGKKTVKVKSQSTSSGHNRSSSQNISLQSHPLMASDEIMQMKNSEEIILIEAVSPIRAKKHYAFKGKPLVEETMT